ncbi:MAG: ABC transporter permease [Acidobacteriota bacterium]|jgi:putative ABC transport system permease protein
MRPKHWFHTLPLRMRSIFLRRQAERELAEEFEYHLEMRIRECIAGGMTPEEARLVALRAMDGMEQHKEECRDVRGLRWIHEFLQDLRHAFRIWAKSPGFTIVAVLMLALGIGANTAVISVYEALVLRPLPFGQIDRLVEIPPGFNYPNYLDIRADDQVFSDLAVWMVLPLQARGANSKMLSGRAVSSNYFQVVGLPMTLGRGFLTEEEKLSGSRPVAVISNRLWKNGYGSDPLVVGKTLKLNDELLTIVGVAPKELRGDLGLGGVYWDMWVPIPMLPRILHLDREPMWRDAIENRAMGEWLWSFGRLRPGVTLGQARARMAVLFANLQKSYPGSIKDRSKPNLVPVSQARWLQGNSLFSAVILAAATLGILFITCMNIANLLLARGSARQREIATRLALGASRARVVRQLLAEGFALSAVALLLSLAVYSLTLQLMSAFEIPFNFSQINLDLGFDRRALIFAMGIGLLTNVMFGLAPALAATRTGLSGALKDQGFLVIGFRKARCRRLLVVSQMILTVVLLVGAGILGRMVWRFVSADPGFDKNVLIVSSDLPTYGIDKAKQMRFYRQSLERIRRISGVRSAAWGITPPFDQRGYFAENVQPEPAAYGKEDWFSIQSNSVSPGYFQTMRIPILQGRDFDDRDSQNPAGMVIINETMARRFWPGTTPVGKQIRVKKPDPRENRDQGPELCEVIGVVKDVKYETPWEGKIPYIYFPYWHKFFTQMSLHVSVTENPDSMIVPIRKLCESVDSGAVINGGFVISTQLESLFSKERAAACVLGISGLLALILAAIGLYGIISYSVTQRTREFGIRMALGARGGEIVRQVICEGMKMVALGLAIGLSCSAALSRFVASRLHGLSPLDPTTYAAITIFVISIAFLAAFLPARRAAANPMDALRTE